MADQGDSEANEGGQSGQPQGGQPQGGQPAGGQPQSGQPQGGQPQGGQPQAGGQPAGGQPQGGQPQAGGQPVGGQPQGGQPAGGQPQGAPGQYQQAGTAEPGVGDIFNREDTKHEMKVGLAMFAVIGLGIGLNILLVDSLGPDTTASQAAAFAGGLGVAGVAVTAPVMIAPLLSGIVSIRVADNLPDLPDQPLYATVGLIGFAGTFVIGILTWLFSTITFDGFSSVGDLFGPWLGAGVGSAVAAVVVLVALDNI